MFHLYSLCGFCKSECHLNSSCEKKLCWFLNYLMDCFKLKLIQDQEELQLFWCSFIFSHSVSIHRELAENWISKLKNTLFEKRKIPNGFRTWRNFWNWLFMTWTEDDCFRTWSKFWNWSFITLTEDNGVLWNEIYWKMGFCSDRSQPVTLQIPGVRVQLEVFEVATQVGTHTCRPATSLQTAHRTVLLTSFKAAQQIPVELPGTDHPPYARWEVRGRDDAASSGNLWRTRNVRRDIFSPGYE